MRRLPFFLKRPWLILRGTFTNRNKPDLDRLRAIENSEDFVWSVLPHAARSFATSILVLPKEQAWAAAIAYLQCRVLDTYEDLHPDVTARPELLRQVGRRWEAPQRAAAPTIGDELATTDRDRLHLLLIERIGLIDEAFASLNTAEQDSITELVSNMGDGMAWAAERFAAQGGLLHDYDQRARYCHHVIGEPALYAMRSLLRLPITDERRADALAVSEMIQLANITRDIEKDLARRVGYDAALAPALGSSRLDAAEARTVATVRLQLMREAVRGVDAYARLVADLPRGISQARGAAVLMLAFTDRYYAGCAERAGVPSWPKRRRPLIYVDGIMASLSPAYARRAVGRTQATFHEFLTTTAT